MCTCFDKSYSEAGFPFLSSFYNYVLYNDNTTVIWWEAENDNNPFTLNSHGPYKVLLGVRVDQPNIPISFSELHPKQVDFNIPFSKFHAEIPPKKLFDISKNCLRYLTNVRNECRLH